MTENNDMRSIQIEIGGKALQGDLIVPAGARGFVLFAHGSGSSRHSPHNQEVARALHNGRLGTLLLDLLTPAEEQIDAQTRYLRFDVPLLAERLIAAVDWLKRDRAAAELPLGLFGASTGAAAALIAAAERPREARAVVSRGGRPDLAGVALGQVGAPTLLIVGGNDDGVLDLNRQAMGRLRSIDKELAVVSGATHLFEEPGALDEVARLARNWFERYLALRTDVAESATTVGEAERR
jgi:putative phosphoribosyl transferase